MSNRACQICVPIPQNYSPSPRVLRSREREKVAAGRMRVVRGKSLFNEERAGVRSRIQRRDAENATRNSIKRRFATTARPATLMPMPEPPDKSLESWIWDAACSIRGAKDAPKYKEFILPLIFAKRLCDVFDDELNRIAKEVGTRAKAFKLVKHDKKLVRFYLPLEIVEELEAIEEEAAATDAALKKVLQRVCA